MLAKQPVEICIAPGDALEIRLYATEGIMDCNMTEEEATMLKGRHMEESQLPFRKPFLNNGNKPSSSKYRRNTATVAFKKQRRHPSPAETRIAPFRPFVRGFSNPASK